MLQFSTESNQHTICPYHRMKITVASTPRASNRTESFSSFLCWAFQANLALPTTKLDELVKSSGHLSVALS